MSEEKVAIIACAGMDKPLGSVARACAFKVVEELKPEDSVLVCILPLVAGVKSHSELIKKYPIITIDGCAERCATKITAKNGGKIRGRIFIPQSAQKHGLKPKASAFSSKNNHICFVILSSPFVFLVFFYKLDGEH